MEAEQTEYLQQYELTLSKQLMHIAEDMRYMGSQLYQSDDIDNVWKEIAPQYMADAVPNIAEYPTVAIAWAGYIGMAIANMWDRDWAAAMKLDNIYDALQKPRGFDAMDEYIMEEVLDFPVDSVAAKGVENLMRNLSQAALSQIRHENIEPQSAMAFHVFARTVRSMFRIGASCELYRLGYKWTKQ